MIKVTITMEQGVSLPLYETMGAAGMDLRAHLPADLTLAPMDRVAVPTGLRIALPPGTEAQIRARSGLALKHGITMANGVGTIDCDYRGEILVALINLGTEPFTIRDGDRIAQMIVARYEPVSWVVAETLPDTDRGEQGFGSTGVSG
ncbi:MAG: dUTP diphosphatase [Clostridiales Family XIII bacterium]|jgi:dUTP pyrophosphatase|nr:dUTP diphosphatase [Clostridiales Family XIII bacterium]